MWFRLLRTSFLIALRSLEGEEIIQRKCIQNQQINIRSVHSVRLHMPNREQWLLVSNIYAHAHDPHFNIHFICANSERVIVIQLYQSIGGNISVCSVYLAKTNYDFFCIESLA